MCQILGRTYIDIQIGINTYKHQTTQQSPSELLFRFNITSKADGILTSVTEDTLNRTPLKELNNLMKKAGENM